MPPLTVFRVTAPPSWPSVPSPWSFSVLKEIELCPRRWALSHATYPDVWSGAGYPRMLNTSALVGQIIHAVVRGAACALATAGCSCARDAAAVPVFRGFGGLTQLVREELDRVIERQRENPRVSRALDRIRDDLQRDVPAMRQQVQQQLQRLTLVPRPALANAANHANIRRLRDGAYYELRLHAARLDLIGIIDLLQLDDGRCAIWEFKTGAVDERHVEQLVIYSLLWMDDQQRNPTGTPAARLVLSYAHHVRELDPLPLEALSKLRTALAARISAAANVAGAQPPPARPAPEHCRACDVRHLCVEYWLSLPSREGGTQDHSWGDVEVCVGAGRGPRSWDAMLLRAAGVTSPLPVVLVDGKPATEHCLSTGMHVRLLQVRQSVVDGVILITISAATEMFRVD